MTIAELGALGEFIGSILTIATLVYLAVQVRQNTAQQRRDASISIQHGQNAVVAILQDPKTTRAYAQTAEFGPEAPVEDRARAISFVLQYLNHFQIVYDLHQEGTLDRERYALWEGFAVAVVAPKGIQAWWDGESGKLAFMPEIRALIDRRLGDEKHPPVALNAMWSIYAARSWATSQSNEEPWPLA